MSIITVDVRDRMFTNIRSDTTDRGEGDLYVPVTNFSSPERLKQEIAVLRRMKLIVAHSSELPEQGSFITCDVLGTPLLVTRRDHATGAAFQNICRHRGARVEQEVRGQKSIFSCGYHGWSYADDGRLRGVPFGDLYGDFDRSCHNLLTVRCEERHGFVWVDLSEAGETVADNLAEADGWLAAYEFDKAVVFSERRFEANVNWKLVMDGAIDLIHPPFLHPKTVGSAYKADVYVWNDFGRHCQVFTPRARLYRYVKEGRDQDPSQAEDVSGWRHFGGNMVLYPNSMAVAMPDHVEFWTVWPSITSPGQCTVHIRALIDPAKLVGDMAERLERSMEILEVAASQEDFPMEETIQSNSVARPVGSYLYGRGEITCQHLHVQLDKDIAEMGLD